MAPVAPFLAILVAAGLARLAGQPPTLDSGDESAGLGGQPSATGGGGPAHKLVYGLAAFLGAAAVTALFWWPISQGASFVFYELPARVAPVVGIAVASVVGAVVLVALAYLGTRARFQPAWRYIAWGLTGVTLGLAVAFAPIVLDMPVTPDEFYRLMWLPSWI
jgi:dolichyl-phosphate-mannose--protein O-mannosyl transferase